MLRLELPRLVPLSRNVTLPVGVPEVLYVTVAVNVTDCPCVEVGKLEDTAVDVPALFT